ncbi:uncharacterized protein [Littorina saxatilis]|uniref:Mitogen-activated protein kinase kinase kinase 19 n=1 Tax=Littorina saxatilis TaxID=31220 RepID=A0AAN9G8H0_9CAEN
MKTESRPLSSGHGRGSASNTGHQGEQMALVSRPQRVSSASNRVGSAGTYFDIANTILGSAGDLDDLLLSAARDGDCSKIEQLLVQRSDIIVDIDCKDKRTGNTALIWAAKRGHNKILQLLLRHGADPTLRNYEAQTALEVATGGTKTMLLDSVNRASECSHRLLLQAAWQGNLEVIRRLLSSGKVLDINCQNAEGLTPLMLVARDVQLFERLAVQLNKHYNPVEVAKEMMKARADVHACDNDGRSCLHYAAQSRATVAEKLVQTFIGGGSEPAQLDKRQYAPIHWASQIGNTNVVVALLDGGSQVNSRGFAGFTPLHISAHNDHQRTAVTLLQHGADVTLTDDRGFTPVDLAKTRKMKMTLKEAWTEATQNNPTPELAPVAVRGIQSRESGSRLSTREESPGRKKGEVIFDGMNASTFGTQRGGQQARGGAARAPMNASEKARRAERQMIQEIESGRYTPSLLHSRENTRMLGTVRNKPGPPVLPNISKGSPSPTSVTQGRQSPESPPPGRRSSQGEELRRSGEDGRNMLSQWSNAKRAQAPMKGRLSKTTPLSTNDGDQQAEDASTNTNRRSHRRTGSDPFSTSITEMASTLENIIRTRGRTVTTGPCSSTQHMSPLRTPLERETTMCVSIPTTIPEVNSACNSANNTISFETDTTSAMRHSSVPTHMMSLPPTSSRILPSTPTFLTQQSYSNLDSALAKAGLRDDDSSSSKEPSPRSDDENPDNKFRVGLANPMELLRSRSLLKEEFILADSRPRDPFMVSSGSDQTSSSSSLSTASSSPREGGVGFGKAGYRRSDPSLLTVTLRDKAMKGTGFRNSDPTSIRKLEMSGGRTAGEKPSDGNKDPNCASMASGDSGGKMFRSQSLRMTQRATLQQQSKPMSDLANTANLKRSQSIGNVVSESTGQPGLSFGGSSQQRQDSMKGLPFSGKGRMVIVRDSYSDFDNVMTASSTNFRQKPPSAPSSSGPPKKSQSVCHDKPESAYIKENTVISSSSHHSSEEQSIGGDRSRHNSESSRMSVSEVAISGVNQLDSSATKSSPGDSLPQQNQPSNANVSKPPVPNSQPNSNSNKSAGQKTVPSKPSGPTSTPAKGGASGGPKPSGPTSTPAKGGASGGPKPSITTPTASAKPPVNCVGKGSLASSTKAQQVSQNKTVANSANVNNSKKGEASPTSSAMSGNRNALANQPVAKPPTVNVPVSKSAAVSKPAVASTPASKPAPNTGTNVSKPSSTVNSTTKVSTAANIAAVSKPVVSKASPSVSSSVAASQKSSASERSPPIRKSASSESLSSQKQSGLSAQGKKASGEGGRKQNPLGASQKTLSTSARDITARLSGAGGGVARASSSSSMGASRPSETSATGRSPASSAGAKFTPNSAASKAAASLTSKQQPSQTTAKPSPSSTTAASTASSKPVAATTTAVNVAKVMQTLNKTTSSPRPSATKNAQETKAGAGPTSAKPIQSAPTGGNASDVQGRSSTSVTTSVPNVHKTPANSGQTNVSKPTNVSKSVPASPVDKSKTYFGEKLATSTETDQNLGTDSKTVQSARVANSTKSIVKSPSDSLLSKKAEGSEGQSSAGKEPLVKITFNGMKSKQGVVISRYCDPSLLDHTPVIVNPFENLSAYQTPRDRSPGQAMAQSDFGCVVGKAEKEAAMKGRPLAAGKNRQAKGGARKGSTSKRPASGTSRQASAGKRKGAKGKESKSTDGDDGRPKSGKQVRSGRRRGKKAADKQLDKEAEHLAQMAAKGNMALISGIGWHVATSCVDASDVKAAHELHMDTSSDSDISDVESIEDAETLMKHLDVNRGNISLTSPRFREIKNQKEKVESMKVIPAMTSDGFPPMNLDVTHRKDLPVEPKLQITEADDDDDDDDDDDPDFRYVVMPEDLEGVNNDLFRELQMGILTPIPEVLSMTGPGNVAAAINRFDRSLKDNQLNDLLEGTPRNEISSSVARSLEPSAPRNREAEKSVSKEHSVYKENSAGKPPRFEITTASYSSSSSKQSKSGPRRTHSLKEVSASEKREKPRRERKFSESKRENDEINDAIEEIFSATNTSMSSTLRSNSSTLKSPSNTLTEGDHHLLRKLQAHAKESPFHATRESQGFDDDDDASTVVGEGLNAQNPKLLKVMHAERFDLGAKVKAMIEAGADKKKIKAMMEADEGDEKMAAKQLAKVMNSFRHMELHAGASSNSKEPLVRSESHRVSKVGLDKVPMVRPSSAGASRSKGRFHELKKTAAGGSAQRLGEKQSLHPDDTVRECVGAHGDYAAVAEALAGDVARDVLSSTVGSETKCSRLSRRGSRAGSASTQDSQEEETIQWKKGNILGKGAFGTVWCGLTSEGELIAVKQIDTMTDIRKAEREYEKVQEEVELLKTLNHPNIVGYLGTSFEDGIVSIFMQFVPGGSIASIIARFGALDEAVFRRYTRQILQGVEYLHDNDVIHRDIKGGNVMLMPNGIIKLIDFGCAKRLCINLSLSQSQILRSMKGTPYWMAPEVVNESGHGKKSDIWSIGCTVFEMATMKPPWAEMNPMAAIFAIGSDRVVPKIPDTFSPEAVTFVERCLTKNQQQRASAAELLKDVFMVEKPSKR